MHFDYKGMETTINVTLEELIRTGVAKGKGNVLKANYRRHPRQMLHARCVSEGINAVCPQVKTGMITPEELMDESEVEDNSVDSIINTQEPVRISACEVVKNTLPENEVLIAKDSRKLRAEINKKMQELTSVEAIRKLCAEYNKEKGSEFWLTFTYHKNEKIETFKDLAESHISRIQQIEDRHTPEAHTDWIERLNQCDEEKYWSFYDGYMQNEGYQSDGECYEALKNAAMSFNYYDTENEDFLTKKQIEE